MRLCNIFQRSEQLALSGAVVKKLKRPNRGREYSGGWGGRWGAICPSGAGSYEGPGVSCAHTPRGEEVDGNKIREGFERHAELQV